MERTTPPMGSKKRSEAAQKVAEMNKKQERHDKTVRALIIGVVLVVVVGIIGGAVLYGNNNKASSSAKVQPDASHPVPPEVNAETFAWNYPVKTKAKEGTPVVGVWVDPQCPACAQFETTAGPALSEAAEDGKIVLDYRPTSFLQAKLGNTSSTDAINALGCVLDTKGNGPKFFNALFANQPREGSGWTNQALTNLAYQNGVPTDKHAEYDACYSSGKYNGWAANSTKIFMDEEIPGTPNVQVNGKELDLSGATAANIIDKILEAAK